MFFKKRGSFSYWLLFGLKGAPFIWSKISIFRGGSSTPLLMPVSFIHFTFRSQNYKYAFTSESKNCFSFGMYLKKVTSVCVWVCVSPILSSKSEASCQTAGPAAAWQELVYNQKGQMLYFFASRCSFSFEFKCNVEV